MNVAEVQVLLLGVGLIDIPDQIAIAISILGGAEIEVGCRQMILVTENLVVFSQIFVLVRRAGEEPNPGIVRAVGQGDVLGDDVCGCWIQQGGWNTSHRGNLAVGRAIGPIHFGLSAGHIRNHLRLRKVALPLE